MADSFLNSDFDEDEDAEVLPEQEQPEQELPEQSQPEPEAPEGADGPSEDDFCFVEVEPDEDEGASDSFVIDDFDGEGGEQVLAESATADEDDCNAGDAFDQVREDSSRGGDQAGLVERIKDNPMMALPLVGGVVILLFSLSSFFSFGAEEPSKPVQQEVEEDLGLIEKPQGIDALTEEEVARRMAEQERKSHLKKEQERLQAEQERRRIYQAEAARHQAEASRLRAAQPGAPGAVSDEERIRKLEQELAMLKAGRAIDRHKQRRHTRRSSRSPKQQQPIAASGADAAAPVEPPPPSRPVRTASFYRAGVTIQQAKDRGQGEKTKKSVRSGTILRARLNMGVRTDVRAEVLAKVVEPVKGADGQVAIPAGAVLHGRARAEKRRVLLDFNRVTFSGTQMPFRGYAIWQKMPGLVGRVIKKGRGGGGSRESILERGAKTTVRGLVNQIPGGGVAGDLARNVAGEGVGDLGDGYSGGFSSSEAVLEVKAGKVFQVVVTGE